MLNDITSWPALLHDVVREFGGERVWAAGLAALEYPPTWVEGWENASKVIERVKREATD